MTSSEIAVLDKLADSIGKFASAITTNPSACENYDGVFIESLTEAVVDVGKGLHRIADTLQDETEGGLICIAKAIRQLAGAVNRHG